LRQLDTDKDGWGASLQIGADIAVTKAWFADLNLKKIDSGTEVKTITGTGLGL